MILKWMNADHLFMVVARATETTLSLRTNVMAHVAMELKHTPSRNQVCLQYAATYISMGNVRLQVAPLVTRPVDGGAR